MARLYAAFQAQTWPHKELIVLDDSPEPSDFMRSLTDDRVKYVHEPERMPVGLKRNRLAEMATGELIAHFDDDDYYAPRYLEHMVSHLETCDMVKLSGWFAWSTSHQSFFYWDTAAAAHTHFMVNSSQSIKVYDVARMPEEDKALWVQKNLVGYGFSYAYTREVWADCPFPTAQHGEDRVFLQNILRQNREVGMFADREGLALVVRHAHDSSVILPQYVLPDFMLQQVFGDVIVDYIDS